MGMVAHNPSTWEVEQGRSLNSKPARTLYKKPRLTKEKVVEPSSWSSLWCKGHLCAIGTVCFPSGPHLPWQSLLLLILPHRVTQSVWLQNTPTYLKAGVSFCSLKAKLRVFHQQVAHGVQSPWLLPVEQLSAQILAEYVLPSVILS